jgi:N-acetylneuraminic acid mutarotase
MTPMPTGGRRGAVAFAAAGKGYLGTGSYTSDFWCYDPTTNNWTAIPPYPGGGRISSVAFNIGNKGYVGTGDNGGPTGDFYEFNPATNLWTPKASMPGLPRMEGAGFGLMGKGYIGTGCDYQSGNNYQDFWRYDPAMNTWQQIVDYSGVARRYMNCFVINTRAYGVFGTSGTNYNDLWEYGNFNGIDDYTYNVDIPAFPNPFSDQIYLTVPENVELQNATLVLYDMHGREVLNRSINSKQIMIDKNGISNGIYFYNLKLNDHQSATGKILAQ